VTFENGTVYPSRCRHNTEFDREGTREELVIPAGVIGFMFSLMSLMSLMRAGV